MSDTRSVVRARRRGSACAKITRRTRKRVTRKVGRRTKRKPTIEDAESSTQAEVFQLLADRLGSIYARADARSGKVQQEIRTKLEDLEGDLEEATKKVTKTICSEIEDLLIEVEDRSYELLGRQLGGR